MSTPFYAGIELGGTKTICLVGTDPHQITDEFRVATTTPEETLGQVAGFIRSHGTVAAIGIGSFGPINVNPDSGQYGVMEETPKAGWANARIYQFFREQFQCPVRVDTDVNAAGLGEYRMGAARGLSNFIYLTVGTGIGGGALINGQPLQGLSHPEMGHISLRRAAGDEAFESSCPYHSHCAEGLASGTAIGKRWGAPLYELPEDHPAWELQAEYLARFCHTLTHCFSPQRIIVGGGVSSETLLQRTRNQLFRQLNGYLQSLASPDTLEGFLCQPGLGDRAGPLGSFLLATNV